MTQTKQVGSWTTEDVVAWLTAIGQPQLEAPFRQNGVVGTDLADLSPDDLRELGCTPFQVKKLMREAARLPSEPLAAAASAPPTLYPAPPGYASAAPASSSYMMPEAAQLPYGPGPGQLAQGVPVIERKAGVLARTCAWLRALAADRPRLLFTLAYLLALCGTVWALGGLAATYALCEGDGGLSRDLKSYRRYGYSYSEPWANTQARCRGVMWWDGARHPPLHLGTRHS